MTKLGIDVSTATLPKCSKPNCDRPGHTQHHKGHEFLWVCVWEEKAAFGKKRSPTYKKFEFFRDFEKQYYEYKSEDCVALCDWHHREIHMIYDGYIHWFSVWIAQQATLKYWPTVFAQALMSLLRRVCHDWLKSITPGENPRGWHDEQGNMGKGILKQAKV